MNINELNGGTVHTTNAVAAAATTASIMDWLPPLLAAIASALAIVWFTVELYESDTGQKVIGKIKGWFKK
jgi:hypothetical protein